MNSEEINKLPSVRYPSIQRFANGSDVIVAAKPTNSGFKMYRISLQSIAALIADINNVPVVPVVEPASVIDVLVYEDLTEGDFVNLFYLNSTLQVRKADACSPPKPAMGFVSEDVTAGSLITVFILSAINNSLSGLLPGTDYYLSTNGKVASTPVTGSGKISQHLGTALSGTSLPFSGSLYIELS